MQSLAQKLTHLCFETITLERYLSTDGDGKTTYSATATTHKARLVKKPRLVRNSKGEEVVSTTTIYLAEQISASINDRITLPDGTQPRILTPGSFSDRNGKGCEVIYT